MKVQEVIDRILLDCCGGRKLEQTCDVLASGHEDMEVTGIVTTFMATVDVIREAVAIGANLIITHEPTYFTGMDTLDWLQEDPVYLAKRTLIEQHGIAIWRFHDHMHLADTDRIYDGLLKELAWEDKKLEEKNPWGYLIEETTVRALAGFLKQKLGMDVIQIVGNPDSACSRIGILVGGGSLGLGREQMPMELMQEKNLDVMICGDITEWTLCAYVNDAAMLGQNKAMIVIGHERSEEWGMKYMAEWLVPLVSGLPVTFVDAKEPFIYL
ncbi:Nif3-like dinuclear metal center hexameric protein [Paenibacillus sonchi]|uniref:Nif3-like dinuclear metal center hexameric protein n=1 Tax=Paenibacillus sonchi TaxID=373687 RepID=UPI001E5B4EE2|nr:Nif3-like dinuclear metal center hexameric protein [Paenibacillus sonchi]MCE3202433.1 Nif3-like dinuclear metal center hexameric protein [Paenibacillus sonchi]